MEKYIPYLRDIHLYRVNILIQYRVTCENWYLLHRSYRVIVLFYRFDSINIFFFTNIDFKITIRNCNSLIILHGFSKSLSRLTFEVKNSIPFFWFLVPKRKKFLVLHKLQETYADRGRVDPSAPPPHYDSTIATVNFNKIPPDLIKKRQILPSSPFFLKFVVQNTRIPSRPYLSTRSSI